MIPRLGIGTAQFGLNYGISNSSGKVLPHSVTKILRLARENDIKTIDTAATYGSCEKVLGECIETGSEFQIITKTPPILEAAVTRSRMREFETTFHNSLKLLRLERVYGLLVHHGLDICKPGGGMVLDFLRNCKTTGRVTKIGVSIYDPLELDKILKFFLPDIVQLPISIADQRFLETGYILDLRRKGVEVHGRSVFLQGLLLQELDEISGNFAPIYDRLELINSKGLDLSMSKLEACLKFVFQVKELSNIIIGLTSENDLKQILQCLSKMEEKYVDFSDLAIRQEQFINPTFWE